MEAVFRHSSADFKKHRNVHPRFFSQPKENFAPSSSSFHGGSGLLYTPPFSFSPSLLNPRHHYQQQQQLQPPLLPLPIPNSYQNTRRINNKARHQSLLVKKSNTSIASPKREKSKHESVKIPSDSVVISSINSRLGPDPKDVPRVLFLGNSNTVSNDQVAKFSCPVVPSVLSPPPSSLPLPTFSLRPKLSCNAEAAAGATDNLRRMLRLR